MRGTFELLNPEVFPGEYDLIFGAFGKGGTSALSSVNVLKPTDGDRWSCRSRTCRKTRARSACA